MDTTDEKPAIFLYTPGTDFVRPYFINILDDFQITDSPEGAEHAVMISSAEIYNVTEGLNFNELTPVKGDSAYHSHEKEFLEICSLNNLDYTILRCAPIICTGMDGYPRQMAEKIYKGVYVNIKDNEAVRSYVHAIDLPLAAMISLDSNDIYNVTDGCKTKINDLADALAWRICQKRIFALKPKWYKFIFGKKKFSEETISLTFSDEKLRSKGDFNPISVTEYLKNHVYDESSL